MDPTPERTSARKIRFKLNQQASADGLYQGMRIAIYAQDQRFRDICPSHSEDRIPAFSPKGSGETRLRQVLCSIKRHRHASGFRLNRTILSNGKVSNLTVNADAKFTARASGLREAICFRFHGSEHHRSPAST